MMTAERKYVLPHLFEYKLVLEPGEDLRALIQSVTGNVQQFRLKQKLEIPVARFFYKEEMEATIARWIGKICQLSGSFEICFNNFGGKPPASIYLHIQDAGPFQFLVNQLRMVDHFIRDNDCPPSRLEWVPQMPVLEKIPEAAFHEMIPVLAGKQFHESIAVENLRLYKRSAPLHDWQLVNSFCLPALDSSYRGAVS